MQRTWTCGAVLWRRWRVGCVTRHSTLHTTEAVQCIMMAQACTSRNICVHLHRRKQCMHGVWGAVSGAHLVRWDCKLWRARHSISQTY